MEEDRWRAINEIFHAALQVPPSDRRDFVCTATKGDSHLQFEIERLLEADEKAGNYLESPMFVATKYVPVLQAGDVLCGRFRILRQIGEGGMGNVFEARDIELGVNVALKQIRPEISSSPEVGARFRREVMFAHRITHPNVCRTYDLNKDSVKSSDGSSQEITFITMELLEGETLASRIKRDGPIPLEQGFEIAQQIGSALAAAHALSIVHRDVKPANIMLVPSVDGSTQSTRAVIMDFGLARINPAVISGTLSSLGQTNRPIGTFAYMAPEQVAGRPVSPATDIYAFGLVLFEMVTGHRPFRSEGGLTETAEQPTGSVPPVRGDWKGVPDNWKRTIQRCLEISPAMRFQRASDVTSSLTSAAPTAPTDPARSHRHPLKLLGGGRQSLLVASLIAAMSLFAFLYRFYSLRTGSQVDSGALVFLTDISNETGEGTLDNAKELLRASLNQSAKINLLDESRVGSILQQMTQTPNSRLDQATARQVAMRAGAVRVIFANLSKSKETYRLEVDIQEPDNLPSRYRHHWSESWTWSSNDGPGSENISSEFLQTIRDASGWIRKEIGESAHDISRLDAPPEDVTTPSWDALNEYIRARRLSQEGRINDAIEALQSAVRIDPNFALAYADLADVMLTIHRESEGFRAYKKALDPQLARRLSRRERDRIKGMYSIDTWDFETAVEAFKDYQTFYDHDLLGWIYPNYPLRMLGRTDEAVSNTRVAIQINPNMPLLFVHMAILAISQNDLATAQQWIAKARAAGNSEDTEALAGAVAFLDGNYEEAKRIFGAISHSQNPRARSRSYERLASLFAEHGLYSDAIAALTAGIKEDLEQGNPSAQSSKLTARALMKSKLGDFAGAVQDLKLCVSLNHSPESLLSIEDVLGPAMQLAPQNSRGAFQTFASSLQRYAAPDDFGAISQIVNLRLKGEALLAKRNASAAVRIFRELDAIDAPMKSREYLGRALMSLAGSQDNSSSRKLLETEAKNAYARVALQPAVVWVDPLAYPPGTLRNNLGSFLSLARLTSDHNSETSLADETYRRVCIGPMDGGKKGSSIESSRN